MFEEFLLKGKTIWALDILRLYLSISMPIYSSFGILEILSNKKRQEFLQPKCQAGSQTEASEPDTGMGYPEKNEFLGTEILERDTPLVMT